VRNTDTRNIWYLINRRCNDPKDERYGGRGVKVCDRWSWNLPADQGYKNFVEDMGLRPHKGLSLERRNNNGNYDPENCKWGDDLTQRRNKSTSRKFLVCGQEMNQCDLAVALGTSDKALSRRIQRLRKDGLTQEQINEWLSVDLHSVQTTSTQHQPRGITV
jgi:biotin operon repressor